MRRGWPHRAAAAAAALVVAWGGATVAAAEPAPRIGVAPQTVLFLKVATAPAAQRRETAIYEQVGLALEGVGLIALAPEDPGFADLPLGRQVAIIRRMVGTSGAAAVTWTSEPAPGQLMAHLVVVQTGRLLIRTFETGTTAGSEASIALAVKELLGTAYLFERPPPGPGGVAAVTDAVRRAAASGRGADPAPAPPAVTAPPPRAGWGLLGIATYGSSLSGHTGLARDVGGALAAERAVVARLHLGLALGASWGPVETAPDLSLAALHLEAAATGSWAWRRGPFAVGPRVAVAARWSRWEARPLGGPRQVLSTWAPRVTAGPEVRLALAGAIELVLWPTLAVTLPRDRFARAADGATLARTGWLDVGLAVGVRVGRAAR